MKEPSLKASLNHPEVPGSALKPSQASRAVPQSSGKGVKRPADQDMNEPEKLKLTVKLKPPTLELNKPRKYTARKPKFNLDNNRKISDMFQTQPRKQQDNISNNICDTTKTEIASSLPPTDEVPQMKADLGKAGKLEQRLDNKLGVSSVSQDNLVPEITMETAKLSPELDSLIYPEQNQDGQDLAQINNPFLTKDLEPKLIQISQD